MKQFDIIAAVLVVVGALNWGLIAVARFDLVAALFGMRFGDVSALSAVVRVMIRACDQSGRPRPSSAAPAPASACSAVR